MTIQHRKSMGSN